MLKFRSMVVDAEKRLCALRPRTRARRAVQDGRDPRITSVGRVLRRYSLDELPQLFNVLGGSMSLVGPRPPLPTEVDGYERAAQRRLLVKPGITGLWQVSGRSDLSWEQTGPARPALRRELDARARRHDPHQDGPSSDSAAEGRTDPLVAARLPSPATVHVMHEEALLSELVGEEVHTQVISPETAVLWVVVETGWVDFNRTQAVPDPRPGMRRSRSARSPASSVDRRFGTPPSSTVMQATPDGATGTARTKASHDRFRGGHDRSLSGMRSAP